jgi:D-alanyl-D-alanine carboxypeptidase/D-alanyl-D-alanine-endopeptidase (penicillin-binding protein 4)
MKYRLLFTLPLLIFLSSCSVSKQIARSARENVLKDETLQTAHVGISIYEPATGKYWYNYNGDNYFVPASNTKLPTCYAAMKYLGDSLVGLRYEKAGIGNGQYAILAQASGDPTFLHPEFPTQPVFDFLTKHSNIELNISNWKDQGWGNGWAWNDYDASYMVERSAMPIYGNVVRFSNQLKSLDVIPKYFFSTTIRDSLESSQLYPSSVQRPIASNQFFILGKNVSKSSVESPFYTSNGTIIFDLLSDTLHEQIKKDYIHNQRWNLATNIIHSQPTDSLLKPMMHRSDNFFAEQSLLMVSNELLGVMNDSKIIDTLLKTDFKDLPQKPRWVDGSGLSRYNLFSPQDFVFILNKMKTDFGIDRIKNILPTGNEGTLGSRFVTDSNYIFAKTGTLSGVVALTGFLYTKKNKLLIFSVLVNNHNASAAGVRNVVEKFIHGIREKY